MIKLFTKRGEILNCIIAKYEKKINFSQSKWKDHNDFNEFLKQHRQKLQE